MKQIKNMGILLFVVAISLSACGQEVKKEDAPARVVSTMGELYPNVKKAKYEKEDANYEANFKIEKKEYSVLIDELGNVLETEIEIPTSELPAIIMEYMKSNYPDKKIKETAIITKGDLTEYEVEIKGGDLIFDGNGILIKSDLKTKKKDEEEGEVEEED